MAEGIRHQIGLLVKLQRLEIEARKTERILSQVGRRTEKLDARLKAFEDAVASGKTQVQELSRRYRALESDLKTGQGRVEKGNEKLRSVKTNKEYQSVLKEIDELTAINSRIEDETLACMEEMEKADAELKGHQREMSLEEDEIRQEKQLVLDDAEQDRSRLRRIESEAEELARRIAPEVLKHYRRVGNAKTDGIGIVAVWNEVCQGCHMNIQPQMYNELQRADRLKNCPNCDRIIFWESEEDRSE
jgi:hypothetical protein